MSKENRNERPVFPKRAVVTAGMPYGNKELHFGHIGGVFVHADTFARFLRDRIGSDNVIFVSGTDCYGSPILESYNKLVIEGKFEGSIEDYVRFNHNKQKKTLEDYEISLNFYGASALDKAGEIHEEVSREVFEGLYEKGALKKLSTSQFFDPVYQVLLNGRQVVGKCPISGCCSDKAYADECSLGHQYMSSDLIDPISTLSGKKPEVRDVENWYFDLESYRDLLKNRVDFLRKERTHRKYFLNTVEEFLKEPMIYVKKSQSDLLDHMKEELPPYEIIDAQNKSSITLVFRNLNDREMAREKLANHGIYFRTGKTLVPFRLTGNIEWGVKVPDKEDTVGLTFWVWPESLWAPISFTRTFLESRNKDENEWKKWWMSKEAGIYQFIGEDNIYFYGIAQMAMFMALNNKEPWIDPEEGNLQLSTLIANNHLLFLDKKASSSGDIKPPMAQELLNFYTAEQLRIHFLSLGLSTKSASFMPKVYMENATGVDTVLKEGNLLTNVFNRLVRSCFYTAQKYYDSMLPEGSVSEKILEESKDTILEFERSMYHHEFHTLTYIMDTYIRNGNKYWVNNIRVAEKNDDDTLRKQILIDSFHMVRTAITLLHSIAPEGCEMVREYLGAKEDIWNWDYIFEPLTRFRKVEEKLKFLEPRVDFFVKHESQFEDVSE